MYINFVDFSSAYCGTNHGWTGPTKLSIINFMVYSKGSIIFLKSVDASDKIKDNKYIYSLLKDVIKEVGEANVVQIVTDNGSAFCESGKVVDEEIQSVVDSMCSTLH